MERGATNKRDQVAINPRTAAPAISFRPIVVRHLYWTRFDKARYDSGQSAQSPVEQGKISKKEH